MDVSMARVAQISRARERDCFDWFMKCRYWCKCWLSSTLRFWSSDFFFSQFLFLKLSFVFMTFPQTDQPFWRDRSGQLFKCWWWDSITHSFELSCSSFARDSWGQKMPQCAIMELADINSICAHISLAVQTLHSVCEELLDGFSFSDLTVPQ